MKKILTGLIFLVMLLSLAAPIIVMAVTGQYTVGNTVVTFEGLVPCGKTAESVSPEETAGSQGTPGVTNPCNLCHLFVMFAHIFNFFLVNLLFPIVMLVITFGAGNMVFAAVSGGNPQLYKKGINIIKWAVLSIAVALGSWAIVNTFFILIGVSEWTQITSGEGWYTINCTDFDGRGYEYIDGSTPEEE